MSSGEALLWRVIAVFVFCPVQVTSGACVRENVAATI